MCMIELSSTALWQPDNCKNSSFGLLFATSYKTGEVTVVQSEMSRLSKCFRLPKRSAKLDGATCCIRLRHREVRFGALKPNLPIKKLESQ